MASVCGESSPQPARTPPFFWVAELPRRWRGDPDAYDIRVFVSSASLPSEDEEDEDIGEASQGSQGCSAAEISANTMCYTFGMGSSTSPEHHACDKHQDCAICLDSFQVGDSVRILPCFHMFHKACVDQWLTSSQLCPICKQDVTGGAGDEKLETDSPSRLAFSLNFLEYEAEQIRERTGQQAVRCRSLQCSLRCESTREPSVSRHAMACVPVDRARAERWNKKLIAL
mmetsp:Transcript_54329/g.101864  ORF Transcript_54329/g.101864 Transcript_54329/m.101864 type:complete len:228 (+) Transcript_54329:34-717(+)